MHMHHIGIETSNPEKSLMFYSKVLNFKEEFRLSYYKEELIFLSNGSKYIELICLHDKTEQGSPHMCFEVENIEDILKKIHFHHLSVIEGPIKLENGWETVFIKGPSGETIEFLKI